jgi:hypothetical protein
LDQGIERQMLRVVGALHKAAEKKWPDPALCEKSVPRKKMVCEPSKQNGSPKDTAKRQLVRDFLEASPNATIQEITAVTGAGKYIVSEVRRELGQMGKSTRERGQDNMDRVREAFEANPDASPGEIARFSGVPERYARDAIKRILWEKSRI